MSDISLAEDTSSTMVASNSDPSGTELPWAPPASELFSINDIQSQVWIGSDQFIHPDTALFGTRTHAIAIVLPADSRK